jgi:citrate lyase subunit beta/citryl-CoA lyase
LLLKRRRCAHDLSVDGGSMVVQYVNFRSAEGLRAQATDVKRLGYRGMFAIHPNQVQTINECFSPSAQEIEYAKKVVAAYEEAERYAGLVRVRRSACSHTGVRRQRDCRQGKGSTSVDGKMVDAPVVKRAYALLKTLPQA